MGRWGRLGAEDGAAVGSGSQGPDAAAVVSSPETYHLTAIWIRESEPSLP